MGCCASLLYATAGASIKTVEVGSRNTLSKSVDVRSRQVSAVCDLELRPGPVLRGRSRTAANETRTETGATFS